MRILRTVYPCVLVAPVLWPAGLAPGLPFFDPLGSPLFFLSFLFFVGLRLVGPMGWRPLILFVRVCCVYSLALCASAVPLVLHWICAFLALSRPFFHACFACSLAFWAGLCPMLVLCLFDSQGWRSLPIHSCLLRVFSRSLNCWPLSTLACSRDRPLFALPGGVPGCFLHLFPRLLLFAIQTRVQVLSGLFEVLLTLVPCVFLSFVASLVQKSWQH